MRPVSSDDVILDKHAYREKLEQPYEVVPDTVTSELFLCLGELAHGVDYLPCSALNFLYHKAGLADLIDALIDLLATSLHALHSILR